MAVPEGESKDPEDSQSSRASSPAGGPEVSDGTGNLGASGREGENAEAREEGSRQDQRGEEGKEGREEDDVVQAESLGSGSTSGKKKSGPSRNQVRLRVNWLIQLLYSRGELEECLRLIDSQLEACGGLCEYPAHVKGLILRQQGKVQEALELFQAATLLNPQNPDNLKQVGKTLFLLGKHRAAAEVLDESSAATHASGVAGDDWEVLHNKGLCLMYMGEYEQALDSFEQANRVQRHEQTFVEMGKVLMAQQNVAQALQVYLEALDFSPDSSDLLTTVGLLYLRGGNEEDRGADNDSSFKAFEYLGNSLTHDPLDARTILAAGSIIQDHGEMDVALVKYRVAAQRTPDSPQLWNNIGMCFFGKQKLVAAVACLKRSLYLDPFQWITAYNLGLVHLATAQHASAFHYLSASINLNPAFAQAYSYLAVALAKLEDPDNAVAAYEKAIELDPEDASTLLNYSATLHNLGRRAECRAQLERYQVLVESQPADDKQGPLFEKLRGVYL